MHATVSIGMVAHVQPHPSPSFNQCTSGRGRPASDPAGAPRPIQSGVTRRRSSSTAPRGVAGARGPQRCTSGLLRGRIHPAKSPPGRCVVVKTESLPGLAASTGIGRGSLSPLRGAYAPARDEGHQPLQRPSHTPAHQWSTRSFWRYSGGRLSSSARSAVTATRRSLSPSWIRGSQTALPLLDSIPTVTP